MPLKHLKNSLITTFLGLLAGFAVGYVYSGSLTAAFSLGFLTLVLAALEVSLSFDNAVVNAAVLKDMDPIWQRRFLTWGILIAVFGMRLVLPVVMVSVMSGISPSEALIMAVAHPQEYAERMMSSHVAVAGFGGTFLLLVALNYFFDRKKEIHWLRIVEMPLSQLGRVVAMDLITAIAIIYAFSRALPVDQQNRLLLSGAWGLAVFFAVEGLGAWLRKRGAGAGGLLSAGMGSFMYLEVLDASFSFDGVIGAFAITNNLFLIMIGLGIGAMFVRSLTVIMVEMGTLTRFRYLEHGAYYAIGALAIMMFLDTIRHVPEILTGLIGALFIALSVLSSWRYNQRQLAQSKEY